MLQMFQGFEHIATETHSLRNDAQLSDQVGIGRDWRGEHRILSLAEAIENGIVLTIEFLEFGIAHTYKLRTIICIIALFHLHLLLSKNGQSRKKR